MKLRELREFVNRVVHLLDVGLVAVAVIDNVVDSPTVAGTVSVGTVELNSYHERHSVDAKHLSPHLAAEELLVLSIVPRRSKRKDAMLVDDGDGVSKHGSARVSNEQRMRSPKAELNHMQRRQTMPR